MTTRIRTPTPLSDSKDIPLFPHARLVVRCPVISFDGDSNTRPGGLSDPWQPAAIPLKPI